MVLIDSRLSYDRVSRNRISVDTTIGTVESTVRRLQYRLRHLIYFLHCCVKVIFVQLLWMYSCSDLMSSFVSMTSLALVRNLSRMIGLHSRNCQHRLVHCCITLNKIESLIERMSQGKGHFKCEACDTKFNSLEELAYHEKYSTYRRPGCCWQ